MASIASRLSPCPPLCVLGGWGLLYCLWSPIRSLGRPPVGLGSSNKIPVPYKPSFSQKHLHLFLGLCLSLHWMQHSLLFTVSLFFLPVRVSYHACSSDSEVTVTSYSPTSFVSLWGIFVTNQRSPVQSARCATRADPYLGARGHL